MGEIDTISERDEARGDLRLIERATGGEARASSGAGTCIHCNAEAATCRSRTGYYPNVVNISICLTHGFFFFSNSTSISPLRFVSFSALLLTASSGVLSEAG